MRDDRTDRQLASYLAAVAGALNARAFYAVGFFSANMTGNISALSYNLAIGDSGPALSRLQSASTGPSDSPICPCTDQHVQCTMKTGIFDPSIIDRVTPPKIRSRILECP